MQRPQGDMTAPIRMAKAKTVRIARVQGEKIPDWTTRALLVGMWPGHSGKDYGGFFNNRAHGHLSRRNESLHIHTKTRTWIPMVALFGRAPNCK